MKIYLPPKLWFTKSDFQTDINALPNWTLRGIDEMLKGVLDDSFSKMEWETLWHTNIDLVVGNENFVVFLIRPKLTRPLKKIPREVWVRNEIAQACNLVPKMIYEDTTARASFKTGVHILVLERIKGVALNTIETQPNIRKQAFSDLAIINKNTSKKWGNNIVSGSTLGGYKAFIMRRFKKLLKPIEGKTIGRLTDSDRENAMRYARRCLSKVSENEITFSLQHADLKPQNFLVDDSRIVLIDYARAAYHLQGLDLEEGLLWLGHNKNEQKDFRQTYFSNYPTNAESIYEKTTAPFMRLYAAIRTANRDLIPYQIASTRNLLKEILNIEIAD